MKLTKTNILRMLLLTFALILIIVSILMYNDELDREIKVKCKDGSVEFYNNISHYNSAYAICGALSQRAKEDLYDPNFN